MLPRQTICGNIGIGRLYGVALILTHLFVTTAAVAQSDDSRVWSDWLDGEFESGLDVARTDRDSDAALFQMLRLNVQPPDDRTWRIRSSVWLLEDLDGHEDPTSTLRSISDASNEAVQIRLLSLYVEQKGPLGKSTTRVGRQRIVDGIVYNRIDGVYTKFSNPAWGWYAFAGARASLYEDAHKDFTTGGGLTARLPTRTRINADLFYGEDERRQFSADDIDTSIFSLSLAQPLNQYHHVLGRASWNENRLDEIRVALQGFFLKSEVTYSLTYRNRETILAERVADVSELFTVLGELNEFEDYSAIVDVPIGEHYGIDFQVQVHDASEDSFNSGNRDYQRYAASLNLYNLPKEDIDVTITVALWNASFGEGQWTVTGEIERSWVRAKLAVGADYDRFEDRISSFDPASQTVFLVDTHENIYSVFTRLRYEMNEHQRIDLRATAERDDGPDSPYLRLRASYTVRF